MRSCAIWKDAAARMHPCAIISRSCMGAHYTYSVYLDACDDGDVAQQGGIRAEEATTAGQRIVPQGSEDGAVGRVDP